MVLILTKIMVSEYFSTIKHFYLKLIRDHHVVLYIFLHKDVCFSSFAISLIGGLASGAILRLTGLKNNPYDDKEELDISG